MGTNTLGRNITLPIYNADGTSFNELELTKFTSDSIVMSLADKITGDVYYKNNGLSVAMTEYVLYNGVKYVLVNPPTVVREGMVADNSQHKGMTKYSFVFYHPMYMLANFPFTDAAVSSSEEKFKSQDKTFSWIGNLTDYVAKLNKNLEGTQWKVSIGTNVTDAEKNKLSEVLSFDNNTIADALKTAYETWEIPYIIDQTYEGSKRFLVRFGLPNNEIYEKDKNGNFVLDDNNQKIPFVFKYGQGVGLKNNSRTPKNNKIVTRIAGYGSEDNIPYGYPQIVWTGNQSWNYTINNDSTATNSYPIYDGIVGGQKVRLIKHPFTRTHLMPPIYSETVNKKVNPNATGYNPNIELVDYYDANDNTYPNQIKDGEPSYEIHEFEDIKPEFGSFSINIATPYDGHSDESITQNKFLSIVDDLYTETDVKAEKTQLNALRTSFVTQQQYSAKGTSGNYEYDWSFKTDGLYKKVKYASSGANFEYVVNVGLTPATIDWDDTMDEQGSYVQSYFKVTIPALGFDLYASAAITQEMTINMRSGACIGCSFPVMVDWDDYKRNFYDKDGNFAPTGTQRNYTKYPNSTNASITLILQKETNTFGTLMPNIYQKPASGDKFVILGISLPTSYITTAEGKLETEMKKYMRDNNVYYYEYPLKFDEHFLISNEHILSQMKPNVIVNFEYADVEQSLYIKQMSIKYNESPLPKYDITLTDDVDVVPNKIGEAIAEYRGQRQYENGGGSSETLDGNKFLRKDINDTASGMIRMLKGLQVGERFVTGLLGEGGIFRKDDDGTTYLECDRMYVRMKAYFDTVEVRRFLHSGGNRIASAAGMKCSRVEYIASNGLATQNVNNAVKFRCYFRAEDNGAKVTNDFVIGDLAYCKETNIDTNLSQHGYWRAVVDVSDNANANGEHWIDLSASDCLSGSDIPIAQDDIIQLGNKTDKTRQGAIIEYVSGEDAPSYQIYQGINTYSLDNKNYIGLGYSSETNRAYMNVYGDMFVGAKPDAITGKSPTYIKYVQDDGTEQHNPKLTIKGIVEMLSPDDPEETTTLDDFAKAITGDIEYLQQQIDGEIDTWFYDGEPTLNNYPASDWTTDTEKKEHLGDLYYDKLNGNAYRFIYDKDNETYSWLLLSDSAILDALRIANEAKDTADNKRRVFLTDAQHPHPTPPYDEGDLWVNAVWPYEGQNIGSTYNDEFLKCTVAKAAGQGFAISDWSRTSTHAENVLQDFIEGTFETTIKNIKNQVDHKVQAWYQSTNPADLWEESVRSEHVGDLWYCTLDIEGTNFKKDTTWQYVDNGEGVQPRYQWKQQNVPEEIFDKIDGKRAIYSEWNGWMTGSQHQFNQLQEEDLFIPQEDTTPYDVTFKANKVYRCTNAYGELIEWPVGSGTMVRVPRFQEIAYTDDSAFNEYITQILNGTAETTNSAIVANALNAITTAITKAPPTSFNGGLVLTSLIGMRDANSKVWAGISGLYKATESVTGQYKGHGIAAWYGGGMADWEVYISTLTSAQQKTAVINDTYAKSLFRFDGSGYLAGGNITWDAQGRVAIKDITTLVGGNDTDILNALTTFNKAFHFTTQQDNTSTILNINPQYAFSHLEIYDIKGNHPVATIDYVNENFVTKAFFNRLFQAYSSSTIVDANKVLPNDTTTVINNLKILVGTWTEQYISALGNNPNASGGGGISDLSAVLNELNSKDDLSTGVLVRNGLNNWSWMPYNAGSSGIDVNAMWVALGGTSGNKKIDNSHLSLKSLTFKAGSEQNGVEYSPTGTDNTTITFDSVAGSGISVARNGNTITIGNTEISGLMEGSYTKVTVDKFGRVIAGENPTTLAGYKIDDAKIENGVITLGSNTITPLTDAKIKNDYTWWGQKLNNSGVVSGRLSMVADDIYWKENNYGDQFAIGVDFNNTDDSNTLRFMSAVGEAGTTPTMTTKMVITGKSGNVGIGTESPSYKLDVNGTIGATANIKITGNDKGFRIVSTNASEEYQFGASTEGYIWGNLSGSFLRFKNISSGVGNVGVGKTPGDNYRLDVSGNVKATKYYLTDTIYFEKVTENGVDFVKLNGNFCATGAVSALGSQSSSGGSYIDLGAVWDSLSGNSDAYGSRQISIGHLTTALNGYLTPSNISTITFRLSSTSTLSWNPAADSDETIDLSSIGGSVGSYVKFAGNQTSIGESSPFSGATEWATTTNIPNGNALVYNNSGAEYSLLYSFSPSNISNYGTILKWSYADTYIRIARKWRGSWQSEDWEKISAGYADKIPQHSFWGRTFDGTGDVSGNMSGVGSISMSDNIYITKTDGYISISSQDAVENFLFGASSSGYIYGSVNGRYLTFKDGHVGACGIYNPEYDLHVGGTLFATGIYRSGSSDSYVLLGGGGHSLISGLSVNKAKILDTISSTEDGALLSGGGLGLFSCGTSSTGTTDGQILTVAWSNNWQTQLFVDAGTIHSVFIRNYSNGTFNDWKYIVTQANIGNQSVNYATGAGNADTIDNFHANGLFQTLKNSTASGHSNEIEIGIGNATKYLTVGYSTNAGTATTASKLSTVTKKAWGQTYWTSGGVPQDISGNMTGVGTIAASGNIEITKNDGNFGIVSSQANETYMFGASSSGYIYGSKNGRYLTFLDGKIGIGTSYPQYKLEVVGNSYFNGQVGIGGFSQNTANKLYVNGKSFLNGNVELSSADNTYIKIGGATLKWTGTALECDKDFYSTGAVSALGSGSSGGGGGISDISVAASLSGTLLTINVSGQTGSVDLSSISGTSGNYIPLSGSNAITGDLTPQNYNSTQNTGCDLGNDSKRWRQIWGRNFIGETIELSGNAKISGHVGIGTTPSNTYALSVLGSGNFSGNLSAPSISTGSLTLNGTMAFAYGLKAQNIEIEYGSDHTDEINNTSSTLWLQYNTGQGVSMCYGRGNVAIGDTPDSFKFKVNGTSKFTDNVGIATDPDDDSDIRLKVDGDIKALSFIPMSDIRKKDIVDYVIINRIEDIARTPIFNFTWKNREKKTLHLGTSAQYIQDIFPNAVTHFSDGDIGLDYGATALAAAVFTARKVVDHELRIKQLEQENAILRKEIEELKAA